METRLVDRDHLRAARAVPARVGPHSVLVVVKEKWKSTELAFLRADRYVERKPEVLPDGGQIGHKAVDHLESVVRSRGDAQLLLAARHSRVVDGLNVMAVAGHQVVGHPVAVPRVPDFHGDYVAGAVFHRKS